MSTDVLTEVQKILNELFNVDPHSGSLETKASDIPEWDSVGHLSLCGTLEEAFGMVFDGSEMAQINSVRAVVAVIERKKELIAEG
jgi:acyl carrier protein